MSHVYIKDDKYRPSQITKQLSFTERYVCAICGCERLKCEGKRYSSYSYSKSGIVFTASHGEPECTDLEAEKNQKQIKQNH